MFIPVKQAACTAVLHEFNKLIEDILYYSIQSFTETLDFDKLKDNVSPVMSSLLDRKKIKEAVKLLFQLQYIKRVEVYESFINDINFPDSICEETYQLKELSENAYKILDELCNGLYDIIKNGSYQSQPNGDGESVKFSVNLLKTQYAELNKEFCGVCPVCLSENYFGLGDGEADHYFPRRKYPALALHPYNLLPTCPNCNGPHYKHTKNPIDTQDIGPGELQTVFLPYLRSAKQEIKLKVSEDYKRYIEMSPNSDADEYTPKRIENLDRLYQLGKRWSYVLSNVYDDIETELIQNCKNCKTDVNKLVELRKTLSIYENGTKNMKDFVKGIYCSWLQEKNDAELTEMFLSSRLDNVIAKTTSGCD